VAQSTPSMQIEPGCGAWSNSNDDDGAWYSLYGEPLMKYTKRHLNDPTARG
jgi:hypothetical protein